MRCSAAHYFHVSNTVTYVAVLAGLGAIVSANEFQSWPLAGTFIALSALADTLDGKFARLFHRTDRQKNFGVQLDSLADALTFGLVPVVCLSMLLTFDGSAMNVIWWIAALFYLLCALTRLAAYNVSQFEQEGFTGIPTTVAGLFMSSFFLVQPSLTLSTALLVACGIAMVSYIPLPRPKNLGLAAFMLWPVALILLHAMSIM